MIKLFLGLLILTNASFSITARKDSADSQEKADFDLYLKAIQDIDEITPHANAHFFDGDRPIFPPNKKDGNKFVLNFKKPTDKEGYSAFKTSWEDVKQYIETNASRIIKQQLIPLILKILYLLTK